MASLGLAIAIIGLIYGLGVLVFLTTVLIGALRMSRKIKKLKSKFNKLFNEDESE